MPVLLLAQMIALMLIGSCASKASQNTSSTTKVRDDDPSSNCADYFANNQAHFNRCKQAQKASTKQRCAELLEAIKSLTDKQIEAICEKSVPPPVPKRQPPTTTDVNPYGGEEVEEEDTEPPNELAEYTLLQQVIIRSSRIHHSQGDCVFELLAMDSLHNGELMTRLEMSKDLASYRKAVATINKLCETKYPVTCSNVVKNKGLSGSKATALIEKCEAALEIKYTRGQEKTLFKRFEHFSIRDDNQAKDNIRHDRCRAKLTGDPLRRYQLPTGPSTPYEYTPFVDLYQAGNKVHFNCSGHKTRAQNLNEKRLLTAYLIFGDLNKTVKEILFQENESIDPTMTNNEGGAKCSLLGDDIGQNYNNNHVTETPPDTLDFNQWEARKLCNTTENAVGEGECMKNIRLHCYTLKDDSLPVNEEERWPAPPAPDAEPPLFR